MNFHTAGFIKESVIDLNPYKINDIDPSITIKLDANESNYSLPKNIAKNYADSLKDTLINLYPVANFKRLLNLLEQFFKISSNNFIFGNGSDELILTILLSLNKSVVVNIPEPSFSMYGIIAGYNDLKIKYINLSKENFDLPENLKENNGKSKYKNIYFLSCPNNPTGNYFNPEIIKNLLDDGDNIVVIDEAYIDFSDRKTYIAKISEYDNLIVLRTFSKIGMAGLRFGMLFAGDKLIDQFKKIKLPFNVNSLTLKSIEFFLNNFEYFDGNIKKTIEQRERVYEELKKLNFIDVYPSEANFIFLKLKNNRTINNFDGFLKENGIIIRGFTGVLSGFFRVSIGKPEENEALIKCLNLFK